MKKVGILTFNRAYSYGAMLQAYALRLHIEKKGYNCELIDYGNIGRTTKLFNWNLSSIKSFVWSLINNILFLFGESKRRKRFISFSDNILKHSEKHYLSKKDFLDISSKYDYIITGSDQVWNPLIACHDTIYQLDFEFPSSRKISYAASFGVETLNEDIDTLKKTLPQIKHLSVREESGVKIVKQITNLDAELVVDPTFLLSSEDWDNVITPPIKKRKYIFYFTILGTPIGMDEFVDDLSKKSGCKILRIGNVWDMLNLKYNYISKAGPKEFLGMIKYAEYIVTNSFHGTALSIILGKNFYTFLNNDGRNTRIESLLFQMNLTDRIKNNNNRCLCSAIDYASVSLKLESMVKISKDFLEKALK